MWLTTLFNKKTKPTFKILGFLLIITLIPISTLVYQNLNSLNENRNDVDQKYLHDSKISGTIHIDHNWTDAKNSGICTGQGTYSDPYLIQDLVIDGGGTGIGILITYSKNDYFRIENCTIFNCGIGIILDNSCNGTLLDNNCSSNYYGIYLDGWTDKGAFTPEEYIQFYCMNNTLNNNTLSNNSFSGIQMRRGWNNTISENNIDHNQYGIYMSTLSSLNIFYNNSFFKNQDHGVYFREDGGYNKFKENKMILCGFYYWKEIDSSNEIDNTNLVNGGHFYFLSNMNDLTNEDLFNAGQIYLKNCNDSVISDFDLSNGSCSISLFDCHDIEISHNNLSANSYWGVDIWNCYNLSFIGNVINDNKRGVMSNNLNNSRFLENEVSNNIGGMLIDGNNNCIIKNNIIGSVDRGLEIDLLSENNSILNNKFIDNNFGGFIYNSFGNISDNIFIGNLYGLYLRAGSIDNVIFQNFFKNNSEHVQGALSASKWNSSTIGNYWDTYTGIDSNGDSIGDTPYNVSSSPLVQDFLPIVDNEAPEISIISPSNYSLHGTIPPSFNLSIKENYIDEMWYSLDGGATNISFTSPQGTLDQEEWNKLGNGTISIVFSVKDKVGHVGSVECLIKKDVDVPLINIKSPSNDEVFGMTAPLFNVEISDPHLDTMWYSINGLENIIFTENGTISQYVWETLDEGKVSIKFYANDSVGNIISQEINVTKDISPPPIIIISPINKQVFGLTSPDFTVEIMDPYLDSMWYSINGLENITITENSTISQPIWETLDEGNISIKFYANDSLGNVGHSDIIVIKDTIVPSISINDPLENQIFGFLAPNFNLSIIEANLDEVWFTFNDGLTNYTLLGTEGIIDQALWDSLDDGFIIIRFYVNDSSAREAYSEVTIYKDTTVPFVNIDFPFNDEIFGQVAPNFNLSIIETNLDSIWYSFDGGLTNHTIFGIEGYINQTVWQSLQDGSLTLIFYVNDTEGNVGYSDVLIYKDTTAPLISINSPLPDDIYGNISPNFNLSIVEVNLNVIWFTLNDGLTNHTFFGTEGTINQTFWDSLDDGLITIIFYANDSIGNLGFSQVNIFKDISSPLITIINPIQGEIYKEVPPNYKIEISELNLDSIWYTLNDGLISISISEFNGTIDEIIWTQSANGQIIIRFYANDTLGNIGTSSITIFKEVSHTEPTPFIPGMNPLINLFVYISMTVLIVWYIKKKRIIKKFGN